MELVATSKINSILRKRNNTDFEFWIYTDDLYDIWEINNYSADFKKVHKHLKEIGIKSYSLDLRWRELDNYGDFEQIRIYHK